MFSRVKMLTKVGNDVDNTSITRFIEGLCNYLEMRFPDEAVKVY